VQDQVEDEATEPRLSKGKQIAGNTCKEKRVREGRSCLLKDKGEIDGKEHNQVDDVVLSSDRDSCFTEFGDSEEDRVLTEDENLGIEIEKYQLVEKSSNTMKGMGEGGLDVQTLTLEYMGDDEAEFKPVHESVEASLGVENQEERCVPAAETDDIAAPDSIAI